MIIDYSLISECIVKYRKLGYQYIDVPWTAPEMQAFLSTVWEWFPESKVNDKPFIEVYNKYNELIK